MLGNRRREFMLLCESEANRGRENSVQTEWEELECCDCQLMFSCIYQQLQLQTRSYCPWSTQF